MNQAKGPGTSYQLLFQMKMLMNSGYLIRCSRFTLATGIFHRLANVPTHIAILRNRAMGASLTTRLDSLLVGML